MEEGIVPADWRDANVTPIFKKGAKSSPSNYRPVSLTSVSCRVMESLIRDAMTSHLTANKLINIQQEPAWICQGQILCHKPARIPGAGYNSGGWRGRF